MSTILHADGIKTVAHTSRYREHEHAAWLRRTGGSAGVPMAASYLQSCRAAEAAEHAAEHARQVEWAQRMAELSSK